MNLRSLSLTLLATARRESSKALAWAAETLPICFTLQDAVSLLIVLSCLGYLLSSVVRVRVSLNLLLPQPVPEILELAGIGLLLVGVLTGMVFGRLYVAAEARLKAARTSTGEAAP
jgi:hypothetical protein